MDYLVTYDIDTTDPQGVRRLAAVAKTCERYGQRAQQSVFECRLSAPLLARLTADIQIIINPNRDSVHIYRLDGSCAQARTTLGVAGSRALGEPWIL